MGKTVKTIPLKGNPYAKVADRIVEFRSDNPRGKIHVERHATEEGDLITESYIWKDSTELVKMLANGIDFEMAKFSCDANGSASAKAAKVDQEKGYEKQETIAVGRGLAMLGYATDGNVATNEEMLAYEQYKQEKAMRAIETACKTLEGAKTIEDLQKIWTGLGSDLRCSSQVVEVKNKMKQRLSNSTGVTDTKPAQNGEKLKQTKQITTKEKKK